MAVAAQVITGRSDGFGWPQRDGLKWPHLALVDVAAPVSRADMLDDDASATDDTVL
jgi:hypothetical protein